MNRKALHKISYGIYIVTSGEKGNFNGQIANSMFQVTSDPATVAISINKENYTHELIKQSRKFAVSILFGSDADDLYRIVRFQKRTGYRQAEKRQNKDGCDKRSIVLENTVSYIEVDVGKDMDCGTHTIFFGNIVDADVVSDAAPMTYAYYQQVKGGKSPKTPLPTSRKNRKPPVQQQQNCLQRVRLYL
jgi:flavin reductase (DIM6/NTAB) family NADH-FMN oxidoreductase RutF